MIIYLREGFMDPLFTDSNRKSKQNFCYAYHDHCCFGQNPSKYVFLSVFRILGQIYKSVHGHSTVVEAGSWGRKNQYLDAKVYLKNLQTSIKNNQPIYIFNTLPHENFHKGNCRRAEEIWLSQSKTPTKHIQTFFCHLIIFKIDSFH